MTPAETVGDVEARSEPDESVVARLLVAYDGSNFRGFAAQLRQRTVAGVLGAALAKVLRSEVELACAGRTDAGVHAWGQVVSFPVPAATDLARLQVEPQRHARARDRRAGRPNRPRPGSTPVTRRIWRAYRYTIVNRPIADPFRAHYAWHVAHAARPPRAAPGRGPLRR